MRCAAGRHFVSAGGATWAPGITLINYNEDSINKYVFPTVIIESHEKSPNLSIFKILKRNDDVVTE